VEGRSGTRRRRPDSGSAAGLAQSALAELPGDIATRWYTRPVGSFNPVQRGQEGARVLKLILDRDDLRRTLVRIGHEIVEKNGGGRAVALVGIHSRGAFLARRLQSLIEEFTGEPVPLGEIDISFYRDDVDARPPSDQPIVHSSRIDFPLEDRTIVLVDDVLYTGRTARAAIEALFDYGRPARVQLAVLVDRGHRELPIRPDYVGKNLPTSPEERVYVRVEEQDGVDEVEIALMEGVKA
jgi:pyrimidine operon attenuation protein / uracil phosphoribosyltransferase